MAWVRLDDGFADHPKVLALSDRAFRIHVAAICYSNRQLTDGLIARAVLPLLGATAKHAADCVAAGVWEVVDGGWSIHDYLDYQPGRTTAVAKSQQNAANGQRGGVAKAKRNASDSPDFRYDFAKRNASDSPDFRYDFAKRNASDSPDFSSSEIVAPYPTRTQPDPVPDPEAAAARERASTATPPLDETDANGWGTFSQGDLLPPPKRDWLAAVQAKLGRQHGYDPPTVDELVDIATRYDVGQLEQARIDCLRAIPRELPYPGNLCKRLDAGKAKTNGTSGLSAAEQELRRLEWAAVEARTIR